MPFAPLPAPSKRPKDPPQPHGTAADPGTFPAPLLGGPGRLQSPPCVRDSCCSSAAPTCEQRPSSSCASSKSEAESSAHTNDNWHFRGWQEKLNPSARCPFQPWPQIHRLAALSSLGHADAIGRIAPAQEALRSKRGAKATCF
ncbi:hypothetical protein DV515_00018600, partial [Chloebia gouldiae]